MSTKLSTAHRIGMHGRCGAHTVAGKLGKIAVNFHAQNFQVKGFFAMCGSKMTSKKKKIDCRLTCLVTILMYLASNHLMQYTTETDPVCSHQEEQKIYIHLTDGWIASCSDNTIRLIYDDRRKMLKHNLHFVGWLLDDANVVLPVETAVWPLSLLMTYTILQFDKLNNIDGGIYMPNSHLSIELFIYVLFIYSFRHQIGASAMNTHDE